MADREFATSLTLTATLPSSGLSGTVTITDALAVASGVATAFTEPSSGHYSVTVTGITARTTEGLWTALWDYGSGTLTQQFTVNPATTSAVLNQARLGVARRVETVWIGSVETGTTANAIIDTSLIGGDGEFIGSWVVPDDDDAEVGVYHRVKEFDADAGSLVLSSAYSSALAGSYFLFPARLNPRAIDRSITDTFSSLENVTFIPLRATALTPDADSFLTIPAGWDYLSALWAVSSGVPQPYPRDNWLQVPGGKIYVPGAGSLTFDLEGARIARTPLFEDSTLDVPLEVLVPGAAYQMHLDFSKGNATDFDAHQQRGAASFSEFGLQMGLRLPRIPRSARKVVR